jgi:hypothetical protein
VKERQPEPHPSSLLQVHSPYKSPTYKKTRVQFFPNKRHQTRSRQQYVRRMNETVLIAIDLFFNYGHFTPYTAFKLQYWFRTQKIIFFLGLFIVKKVILSKQRKKNRRSTRMLFVVNFVTLISGLSD